MLVGLGIGVCWLVKWGVLGWLRLKWLSWLLCWL